MKRLRALSIKEPFAEQILRGTKKLEYRDRRTNVRGPIYIYASKTPGDSQTFKEMNMQPSDLPTGVLVGTVEIVDCTGGPKEYVWHLANPERLPDPIEPNNQPQPIWFYPF